MNCRLHYHIRQQALLEACRIAGGETALGKTINVSQPRIANWISNPAISPDYKYGLLIERLTGVSVERLCPDEINVNQLVKNRHKTPYKAIPQMIAITSINVKKKQYRDDLSLDIAKKPICIDDKQHLLCGYTTFCFYQQKGYTQVPVIILDAITLLAGLYEISYLQSLVPISERALLGEYLEKYIGNQQGKRTDLLRKKEDTQNKLVKASDIPLSAAQLLQNFAEVDSAFFIQDKRTRIARCLGFNNHESYRQAKVVVHLGIPDLVQAVDEKRCALYTAIKIAREDSTAQRAFVQALSGSKPTPKLVPINTEDDLISREEFFL